jgi:site-specific recombinase XerD
MKLSRAVQEFLSEGRTYLSPATLAAYESDLGRLAALVSPYSVLGFTPDVIRAYFRGLSNQNRRMATLFYRKHSALQEFGRLGVRKAFWIRNPMEEIQHPPSRGTCRGRSRRRRCGGSCSWSCHRLSASFARCSTTRGSA